AVVARPGRGIERRPPGKLGRGDIGGPRQTARRQALQRLVLGGREARHHAQEALELVTLGQRRQTGRASREEGGEVGQPHRLAEPKLTKRILTESRGWQFGRVAQGLPTSWRNHLRWCLKPQPRVTEPRVMARNVPRTQITA